MPLYPNARAFLQAVYERYRSLEGYSDTGVSRSLGLRRPRICTFETSYLRPGLFRFAFETPHPSPRRKHLSSKCVVGHDGEAPYFFSKHYSGAEQLEHPESLDLAVAGATGISSATAHHIGSLLFVEISGFTLLDLRRVRFRRNRMVLGVPCISVSGHHPRGGRYTAWFGADDLLLRRLYRSRFNTEELRFNVSTRSNSRPEDFHAPRVET